MQFLPEFVVSIELAKPTPELKIPKMLNTRIHLKVTVKEDFDTCPRRNQETKTMRERLVTLMKS